MNILKLLLVMILFGFTSCDCVQYASGIVVDETLEPLSGVQVHKEYREGITVETDQEGNFEIEGISGGIYECPPMTVIIMKDGYETQRVTIKDSPKIVKLKQIIE